MKSLIYLFLFSFIPTLLIAQGFNTRNGRNHPELEWRVAETEHFKIMYPQHLAGIEAKAAPIAEESYEALSKNLDTRFSEKIRIYLSDEDEIANGFAVPVGHGYTDIWVNINSYAAGFTGEEKWLRKVIAHELAHIFHFESTRSNMGMWRYVFADPTPRFWAEGLAQYQTEKWDSQRGDRWLRLAVFDDQMNYNDGNSPINGRLRYAVGNSQLRYFTETYGDTALTDLLQRRKSFLGFFEVHDFYDAFEKEAGKSYTSFYDEWRKHVNVYYNTLASRMVRSDSLGSRLKGLPGNFHYDFSPSPDESQFALLAMTSVKRPVRRLYLVNNDSTQKSKILAEGAVNADIDWHPEGHRIAYSRTVRGSHGSLVPDIHVLNVLNGGEVRLTHDARATYPAFGKSGDRLAYIANQEGTANIFLYHLESEKTQPITHYTGDVQLIDLVWNHSRNELVYQRFDEAGNRNLVIYSLVENRERTIDDGLTDNRKPVMGPEGRRIAFTSLRDEVPNVFMYDIDRDSTWRVTNLFTGGEVHGWTSPDKDHPAGRLYILGGESKNRDSMYEVDASISQEAKHPKNEPFTNYASWRTKTPPHTIPSSIDVDAGLIRHSYDYKPLRNITHIQSLALPYYENSRNYGLMGMTAWTEPLGKHSILAAGYLALKDTKGQSYGTLSYVNNTLYPSLIFSAYHIPGSARWYQDRFLIEHLTGGEITALFPIDALDKSYQSSSFGTRLRHVFVNPIDQNAYDDTVIAPAPQKARQTDLQLSWMLKKQRPWHDNLIHPLDGHGIKLTFTGAPEILASETSYFRSDLQAFKIYPGMGLHRVYLYGRLQAQFGSPLPQHYIGFSRYDNIDLPLPGDPFFQFVDEAERVRGYRSFVAGEQVAFGTLEYRMPFLSSLNTRVLGFLSLSKTTFSLFADGGVVWNARTISGDKKVHRLGLGSELKNEISLGPLTFVHSLGVAQPYDRLFGERFYDLYYRVQASVPF